MKEVILPKEKHNAFTVVLEIEIPEYRLRNISYLQKIDLVKDLLRDILIEEHKVSKYKVLEIKKNDIDFLME